LASRLNIVTSSLITLYQVGKSFKEFFSWRKAKKQETEAKEGLHYVDQEIRRKYGVNGIEGLKAARRAKEQQAAESEAAAPTASLPPIQPTVPARAQVPAISSSSSRLKEMRQSAELLGSLKREVVKLQGVVKSTGDSQIKSGEKTNRLTLTNEALNREIDLLRLTPSTLYGY